MNSKKTKEIFALLCLGAFIFGMFGQIGVLEQVSDNEKNSIVSEPNSSADLGNLTEAPAAILYFERDGVNVSLTLEQIVQYVQNDSIDLYEIEYKDELYKGVSPLNLLEIVGWGDTNRINITSGLTFGVEFNTTELMMLDGNFYKDSNDTPVILAFMCENSTSTYWLKDHEEDDGDFRILGDSLFGSRRPKQVDCFRFLETWEVDISFDGELVGTFSSLNITNINLNYTTYDWGYDDDGYGWDNRSCDGVTVESILAELGLDHIDHDINFIAYDGYGMKKTFTGDEMINGYTGTMINDGTEELSNEGKTAMLMEVQNSTLLGYNRGPYQLVIPGATKGNYIGGINEIRVWTNYPEFNNEPQDLIVDDDMDVSINASAEDNSEIDTYLLNTTYSGLFSIDSEGMLINSSTLIIGEYSLKISVSDEYGNVQIASIVITVIDDNEAPVWDSTPVDTTFDLWEDVLIDCGATDEISVEGYTIDDTVNFAIDSDGMLTNATTLEVGEYEVTISVSDESGNVRTVTITISIVDPNEKEGIPGFPIGITSIFAILGIASVLLIRRKSN